MSGILNAIGISSRGLSVQRAKMNTVAQNMANAETTQTEEGGPYRRKRVLVSEQPEAGLFKSILKSAGSRLARTNSRHIGGKSVTVGRNSEVSSADIKVKEDAKSAYRLVHDPNHPDADAEGYVKMPDIEIITEMVDMMSASRAYEANTAAISTAKQMAEKALDI